MSEAVDILVVDDHVENILALQGILDRPDYRVITASSGSEALKQILRHDIAVIVLDVVMPEMDGFETATLIRSRDVSRHIPIIFLTANSIDVSQIYRAYAVGAVDYLIKPIEPEVVRAKVAVFVDLHKKTRRIRRQEEQLREAERLRGERALRHSEALYEATFTDAAVGIAHASADGRWLRSNRCFQDILGYSAEELRRLRLVDILDEGERVEAVRAQEDMLAGRLASSRREVRCRDKAGRTVWANLTVSVLGAAGGAGAGPTDVVAPTFIVVMEDITEQKHREERQRFFTRASDAMLESLDLRATLQQAARFLVPAFADFCLIQVAAERDRGDDILIGQLREDGGDRGDRAAAEAELRRLLQDAKDGDRFEALLGGLAVGSTADIQHKNGSATGAARERIETLRALGARAVLRVPIAARGVQLGCLVLGAAEPGRYAAADEQMARDIGQRFAFAIENARLYDHAQAAVEARDVFLSVASHELRTPLTPLLLSFQRLLGLGVSGSFERTPPEKTREILSRCERQIRRLTGLVDALLDVSRIAARALRLERSQFDLAEVVRDVVGRFSEQASEAGSTMALKTPADQPLVGSWDRLRIEQVVTNLVSNAVKYGNGREIEISIEQQNGHARLSVKDHGIGIEPETLPQIFDRFERAPSALQYGGLGLGLYIARQLVDEHGGSIDVVSEPGRGSCFTVRLPLSAADN